MTNVELGNFIQYADGKLRVFAFKGKADNPGFLSALCDIKTLLIVEDAGKARVADNTELCSGVGAHLFNLNLYAVLFVRPANLARNKRVAVFVLQCEVVIFAGD
ncbi:hypothetical protein D3C80_1648020 [compost metagenome]